MSNSKPVHSLVLDAGPIIKNDPPVSTLLQKAESLFTTPAVLAEIKDASTRARISTTLQPFLNQRAPTAASIKLVSDFARKTGDLHVLSNTDIGIIALTYDLECERNQGNWRLRSTPGQIGLNGRPPERPSTEIASATIPTQSLSAAETETDAQTILDSTKATGSESASQLEANVEHLEAQEAAITAPCITEIKVPPNTASAVDHEQASTQPLAGLSHAESIEQSANAQAGNAPDLEDTAGQASRFDSGSDSDSDSEGWITPANLKRRQAQDASSSVVDTPEGKVMQAAVLTTDFAMQNVLLQINLNLLSPSLQRVKNLKTFVLRCHACFQVTKEMSRQFCPRCGGPTLTRVSCSTDANGEFRLHLKKNMQWNHRGERYSIPKPMHGSANGRNRGGGKNGWGHGLILTEDQKEFERASFVDRKHKEKSLMDEDYLPSILTGDRSKGGGRIQVGAGRNINARKR